MNGDVFMKVIIHSYNSVRSARQTQFFCAKRYQTGIWYRLYMYIDRYMSPLYESNFGSSLNAYV